MEATSRKQSQAVQKKTLFREERIPYRGKPCFLGPYFNTSGMKKEVWKGFHRTIERIFFISPLRYVHMKV